ncbi:MAG: FMN-binding protein [Oscillospiraceae bacterium]|nr:FMN-binding protein [Oscillospiraceae bacterium]
MKLVKEFLIPVAVLTVICLVVSAALAFTYQATAPIIEEAKNAKANEARAVVLEGAAGFEKMNVAMTDGGVDCYRETAGAGYVITVTTSGYGGAFNMMVGIKADGTISGIQMMDHSETPGFGAKLAEESYAATYKGKSSADFSDVAGVAGATITSGAYKKGLGTAFEIHGSASGNAVEVPASGSMTLEDAQAQLFPDVAEFTETALDDDITVYQAGDQGYVAVRKAVGYHEEEPMLLAVGLDNSGKILAVIMLENHETQGLGTQVADAAYLDQYIGKDSTDGVTAVAGATVSSDGVKSAVKKILEQFPNFPGQGAKMDETVLAAILPGAAGFEEPAAAYEGADQVLFSTVRSGMAVSAADGEVKLAVGFNGNGVITGVSLLAYPEADEAALAAAQEYAAQFVGQASADAVGASDISYADSIKNAVGLACTVFEAAKGELG